MASGHVDGVVSFIFERYYFHFATEFDDTSC